MTSCCHVSGYAMLLMNTGNLDQAIDQFTNIIKVPYMYIVSVGLKCSLKLPTCTVNN